MYRVIDMEFQFWRLLHDGGIDAIRGEVPGDISVEISIQYLRQQFPGDGRGFKIELTKCSELTYCEYDSAPVAGFREIVALAPEIVSVEEYASRVVVNCVMGSLSIAYEGASVYLDTGEEVSFDDLSTASRSYWSAWLAGAQAGLSENA
ncbi:hypothetical protein [Pseudoduganella sp. HUAS MS19]